MDWGAVYKISVDSIVSKAPQPRQLPPQYFLVTDKEIVIINEEDNEKAVKKLADLSKQPEHAQDDLRAVTQGKVEFTTGPWTTEITVKGDLCTYLASHNSGHFSTYIWKKGVGLIEIASGYGAEADGYRLKRETKK
jgi:hypothetical protein